MFSFFKKKTQPTETPTVEARQDDSAAINPSAESAPLTPPETSTPPATASHSVAATEAPPAKPAAPPMLRPNVRRPPRRQQIKPPRQPCRRPHFLLFFHRRQNMREIPVRPPPDFRRAHCNRSAHAPNRFNPR